MKDEAITRRRNLIIISSIVAFMWYAEVTINAMSINGMMVLVFGKEGAVHHFLLALIFYFLTSFLWCAIEHGDRKVKFKYAGYFKKYASKEALSCIARTTAKRRMGEDNQNFREKSSATFNTIMSEKFNGLRVDILDRMDSARGNGEERGILKYDIGPCTHFFFFDEKNRYFRSKIISLARVFLGTTAAIDYTFPLVLSVWAIAISLQ